MEKEAIKFVTSCSREKRQKNSIQKEQTKAVHFLQRNESAINFVPPTVFLIERSTLVANCSFLGKRKGFYRRFRR